jgi:CubicO group peptidase (beta-lactamase class C family)
MRDRGYDTSGMRTLLLLFAAALLPAQDFAPLEQTAREEIARLNIPGAAVAIVRNGEVIFSKSFGVANVETGEPVRPAMLFRLGSTTKQLTAAAVVGLAVEGKLDLNAPLSKYITSLPPRLGTITANQLLSHTAGIRDEAPMFGSHDDNALGLGIRRWTDEWLFAPPGAIFSYSNPGYWMAGYLLEVLTGKPYADAMEERVFRPLGMSHTTLRPTVAMTYPLAQGHEIAGGKPAIIRPAADNAGSWPAGSIFSNVDDLARWVTTVLERKGIDPRVIDLMVTPHARYPGTDESYGYGISLLTVRGVRLWDHSGSRAGYGSQIRMAPDQKVGIIVQTNRTGANLPATVLKAMDILLPLDPAKAPTPKAALPVTPADLSRLPGTYRNGEERIQITAREGKLYLRRGDGVEAVLSRRSDSRVAAENGPEYFFMPAADGNPAFLYAGSRSFAKFE